MSYISELINIIDKKQQEIDAKIEIINKLQMDLKTDQVILNSAVDAVKQLHENQQKVVENQDRRIVRLINNQ